jgi:hypothetical protein
VFGSHQIQPTIMGHRFRPMARKLLSVRTATVAGSYAVAVLGGDLKLIAE